MFWSKVTTRMARSAVRAAVIILAGLIAVGCGTSSSSRHLTTKTGGNVGTKSKTSNKSSNTAFNLPPPLPAPSGAAKGGINTVSSFIGKMKSSEGSIAYDAVYTIYKAGNSKSGAGNSSGKSGGTATGATLENFTVEQLPPSYYKLIMSGGNVLTVEGIDTPNGSYSCMVRQVGAASSPPGGSSQPAASCQSGPAVSSGSAAPGSALVSSFSSVLNQALKLMKSKLPGTNKSDNVYSMTKVINGMSMSCLYLLGNRVEICSLPNGILGYVSGIQSSGGNSYLMLKSISYNVSTGDFALPGPVIGSSAGTSTSPAPSGGTSSSPLSGIP